MCLSLRERLFATSASDCAEFGSYRQERAPETPSQKFRESLPSRQPTGAKIHPCTRVFAWPRWQEHSPFRHPYHKNFSSSRKGNIPGIPGGRWISTAHSFIEQELNRNKIGQALADHPPVSRSEASCRAATSSTAQERIVILAKTAAGRCWSTRIAMRWLSNVGGLQTRRLRNAQAGGVAWKGNNAATRITIGLAVSSRR